MACLVVGAIALSITSCAKYRSQPLTKQYISHDGQPAQPVSVSVKKFTVSDCKEYLGRDVIKKGFQPLQITVYNNTDQFLLFSKDGMTLTVASPEEVSKTVETSTVGRATGYGVAGLFIWPLLIPAVVDGVKSSKANTQLSKDYAQKAINNMEIIPYATATGIVFVPVSQMRENFTITLVNRDTHEKYAFPIQM